MKRITIIGYAENARAGAVVISNKDQKNYYLDKIDFWENVVLGKTIKVTGKLKVEERKPAKPGEDIRQEIKGEKRTLKKAKWELIESSSSFKSDVPAVHSDIAWIQRKEKMLRFRRNL